MNGYYERMTSVQWAVGLFTIFSGMAMISIPAQFIGPLWLVLRSHLLWIGWLWIICGVTLIGVSFVNVSRKWFRYAHIMAGLSLLIIAYNGVIMDRWGTVIIYSMMAFGTIIVGSALPLPDSVLATRGYYWSIIYGSIMLMFGLMMLLTPGVFESSVYAPIQQHLNVYGVMFVLGGISTIATWWKSHWTAETFRILHFTILVPCLLYTINVSLPIKAWTGIALFGGLSLFTAGLPWIVPIVKDIDPRSIEARLAAILIVAMASPLLITATLLGENLTLKDANIQFGLLIVLVIIGFTAGIVLARYGISRRQ